MSLLIALLLLAGAVVFWFNKDKIQTNQFAGNVVSVTDNSILVQGTYTIDGVSVGVPELKEVEVLVDQNTQITRESFKIPAGAKSYKPDELPKQINQVGLEQIKVDSELTVVGINIEAKKNIYGKNKFTASKITYRVPDLTSR